MFVIFEYSLKIFLFFWLGAFGRREANVFEPTQFSLKRIYGVQWKKQALCLDELAKLYHDKGLTVTKISEQLRVPRTTVHDAVLRLKSKVPSNGGSE